MLRMTGEEGAMPGVTALMEAEWEAAKHPDAGSQVDWDAKYHRLMEDAAAISPFETEKGPARRVWLKRFIAAAVLLIVAGTGVWLLTGRMGQQQTSYQHIETPAGPDILPGTNGAILTLGNGRRIVLDSAGSGVLATEGGTEVVQGESGVKYHGHETHIQETIYNTVQTPRGRQFRLVLADGTAVWLNAASSIRFPTAFHGRERRVEISGEAYFEVAKQAGSSFVVACRGMEVRVLGTHFNLQAYEDEATMETTLLEGSVKVAAAGQERMLKPGEQSLVSEGGEIKIQHEVNTDAIMAWKNGYFSFDQTNLYAVMRQLARWYDVEIEYEGRIPDRRFGGEISRNSKASEVLRILEESSVHFRIEDKKIIVMP